MQKLRTNPTTWTLLVVLALAEGACDRAPSLDVSSASTKSADARVEFDLKVKCLEVGRKFWETEFNTPRQGEVSKPPMYGYSRELNTCVLFAGFYSKANDFEYLIDVLSNRELAAHSQTDGVVLGLPAEEFAKRKKQFFPDLP